MPNKNASAVSTCLLAATTILLALFVSGFWGTQPANPTSIQDELTLRTEDGVLLSLNVGEEGMGTVSFHNINLTGRFVRSFSTQTSATYTLLIDSSSKGDAEHLSFQMQIPHDGFSGNMDGIWYLRFRNSDGKTEDTPAQQTNQDVWYASDASDSQSTPYEIFGSVLKPVC